jgi:hypothetical protein
MPFNSVMDGGKQPMEVLDSEYSIHQDFLVLGLDIPLVLGCLRLHIGESLSPSVNESERCGVRHAYSLISEQRAVEFGLLSSISDQASFRYEGDDPQ